MKPNLFLVSLFFHLLHTIHKLLFDACSFFLFLFDLVFVRLFFIHPTRCLAVICVVFGAQNHVRKSDIACVDIPSLESGKIFV